MYTKTENRVHSGDTRTYDREYRRDSISNDREIAETAIQ